VSVSSAGLRSHYSSPDHAPLSGSPKVLAVLIALPNRSLESLSRIAIAARRQRMERYSRQMIPPQVGYEGQLKLARSRVLVVGAGGIGSTAAMYLAASGVCLDVLDFDTVETSNLHRQIIHEEASNGEVHRGLKTGD
jgi:hypothetical protein